MEFTAALGLDIAAVGIVLYCAVTAARKGFLRTVVQMIAYVAILLAASFLSRAAAPMLYDQVVEPMLERRDMAREAQPKSNAQLVSVSPQGILAWSGTQELTDSLAEILPDDFDPEALAEDLVDHFTDDALRPMALSAIQTITFVVVFALLSLLANLLLSTLGVINYLPVIGTFNAMLGCLVGILQGLLLVWMLALLLDGILFLHPGGWWVFDSAVTESTLVFKYFMNPALLKNLGG